MITLGDLHGVDDAPIDYQQTIAKVGYGKLIPFPGRRGRQGRRLPDAAFSAMPVFSDMHRPKSSSGSRGPEATAPHRAMGKALALGRSPHVQGSSLTWLPSAARMPGVSERLAGAAARGRGVPHGDGGAATAALLLGYLLILALIAYRLAGAISWGGSLLVIGAAHVVLALTLVLLARPPAMAAIGRSQK